MNNIRVVAIDPIYPANIGYLARVMKNFGCNDLYLVGSDVKSRINSAFKFAVHAIDILEEARIVANLNDALNHVKIIVGTTAKPSTSPRNIRRHSLTVKEFVENFNKCDGKIAILFGREDYGLINTELEVCDLIVTIPVNPVYPTLNISHAASIILYDLFTSLHTQSTRSLPDRKIFNRILKTFDVLVASLQFPVYKQTLTKRAFRNIISRSMISKREATLILGVLQRILNTLK